MLAFIPVLAFVALSAIQTAFSIPIISLNFATPLTSAQREGFLYAQEKLNELITTEYPAVASPQDFSVNDLCGVRSPDLGTINEGDIIQSLTINVVVSPIDGVGGILGQAGPCSLVLNQGGFQFPASGILFLDTADVDNLVAQGTFNSVALHEMLHIVGIGTRWANLRDLSSYSNPLYIGARGKEGYQDIGGPPGAGIPIANTGGPGTRIVHWRESTFRNELMTGYLSGGYQPLSLMTAKSLQDIGFTVNLRASIVDDTFTVPSKGAFRSSGVYMNDIVIIPDPANNIDVSLWKRV